MSRTECFWWGAFGAILPQVVKFFKIVAEGDPLPHLNWILYFIVLAVFVCAAGGFSIAWKPENRYKAIWIGASLPVLVSTLVQAVPAPPSPSPGHSLGIVPPSVFS